MAVDRFWTGLALRPVSLVARYWVRFSLRTGGGLIALLAVLIAGLSVASIFIQPVESLMKASPELGYAPSEGAETIKEIAASDQFVSIVQSVTGTDETQARYLLQDNPALLSAIFVVLLWIFPFIACLGAFNQTAGDIGNRGLRYLLLRTERPNVLLGRFVGTVAAAKLATIAMFAVLVLYVGLKLGVYPWGDTLLWSFQGLVAVLMITVPYVAMCAWISAALESAFLSLFLGVAGVVGPLIFFTALDAAIPADLDWLDRLVPWGWNMDLLSGDPATRVLAYAVMVGFTLLFLLLALRTFQKRDL